MTKATKLDQEIGEKIRINRIIAKKSRRELGKNLGVCYQQIQNYETGKSRVAVSCLLNISKFLRVPIEKFLPKK